jgi:hypothetical protein
VDKESLSVSSVDVIWPEGYFDLVARFPAGLLLILLMLLGPWPVEVREALTLLFAKDASIAAQVFAVAITIMAAWMLGFAASSLGVVMQWSITQRVWDDCFTKYQSSGLQEALTAKPSGLPKLSSTEPKGDGVLHEWLKLHVPGKDRFLVKKAAEARLPCAVGAACLIAILLHLGLLLLHASGWHRPPTPTIVHGPGPGGSWLAIVLALACGVLAWRVARREVVGKLNRQFEMFLAWHGHSSAPQPTAPPLSASAARSNP